jgi:hypothetical protein
LEAPYDENMVFTFHTYSPFVFTHQKALWVQNMTPDCECNYPLSDMEMYERSHAIFGSDFDGEFLKDPNVMLDKEYFKRMFAPAIQVAEKFNVPLYCGEYGVIDRADCHQALNWFKDINAAFEELGIARSVWTYKDRDFGLMDDHLAPVLDELIKVL